MKVTIFYSWQSDLPNNTNRGLIERALQKAIDSIKADAETVLEPCLERDTAGVPGTPDIATTIFRKIDECQVFVGDVSIINAASADRKMPNPNVLLELGYAARAVSWDNVICVFNTAYGDVSDLPFDLRLRRMCTYAVTAEQAVKADERDKLAAKFKEALVPVLRRFAVKVQEDAAPKAMTPEAGSARVKEYLADDRHRIALSDLVIGQGNDLAQRIVGPEFPVNVPSRLTEDDIKQRVQQYEDISRVSRAIMMAGCYYGTAGHEKLWIDLLQRVANPPGERNGSVALLDLRRYPALLLLYSGGIAAVAGEHHATLLGLLTKPKVTNQRRGSDEPPLRLLTTHEVIEKELANQLWGQRWYAPVSEHIFGLLRESFRVLLSDDRQYQRCFDRFEYLRSLLDVDVLGDVQSVGCYGWRWKHPEEDVRKEIEAEERAVGRNWSPYRVGWFSGHREGFMAAKKKVDDVVARLGWH